MASQRVSFQDRAEALAVCAKIRVKHPDILERLPDGLYPYMVGSPDEREVLFDYLACDRVAKAGPGSGRLGTRTWIGCERRSRGTDAPCARRWVAMW
jgi:hypothetical protein